MPEKIPTLISWSSGKDSAWTLHQLNQSTTHRPAGLLTTLNSAFDRVAMHGTRRAILEAQAAATGLPLTIIPLPWPCTNEIYEALMAAACATAYQQGIRAIAFGDLFLEDIRSYRIERLKGTGIEPIFPLWQIPTHQLARDMIAAGLKTRIVCLDPTKLSATFAGRELDEQLLADLPPHIDPCGENGEFHTCTYAGPMFRQPIPIQPGETVLRDNFLFADLLLKPTS